MRDGDEQKLKGHLLFIWVKWVRELGLVAHRDPRPFFSGCSGSVMTRMAGQGSALAKNPLLVFAHTSLASRDGRGI